MGSKKVLSDISEENEEPDKTKITKSEEIEDSDTEEEIIRESQNPPRSDKHDDDDYDDDDDDDEDEDEDEDDEDELENGHISPNDIFDESDVDIQDVLSQFFQNSEGENIPEMMNDLRIAIDNNSKCILKVAKELKTMNALYAKKR